MTDVEREAAQKLYEDAVLDRCGLIAQYSKGGGLGFTESIQIAAVEASTDFFKATREALGLQAIGRPIG